MKLSDALAGIQSGMKVEPPRPDRPPQPKQAEEETEPVFTGPSRYIVTSKRYEGQIELIYMNGLLKIINMQDAALREEQTESFKKSVPHKERFLSVFQKAT